MDEHEHLPKGVYGVHLQHVEPHQECVVCHRPIRRALEGDGYELYDASFVVGDVFQIKGRGPCITRSKVESRLAWDAGARWRAGDHAVCHDTGERAIVVGVERHCVAPDHPAYFDGSLLLRSATTEPIEPTIGQTWYQTRIVELTTSRLFTDKMVELIEKAIDEQRQLLIDRIAAAGQDPNRYEIAVDTSAPLGVLRLEARLRT